MSTLEWIFFTCSALAWIYSVSTPDPSPVRIITDWSWCPDGRLEGIDAREPITYHAELEYH